MPVDFDKIYSTDLVYYPDCWRLCGDAYCCNFSRYKNKFKLIERTPAQELPLIPGEYEFLREKNWLVQFQDHDHRSINYAVGDRSLKIDLIVSRRPGCACDHGTRTTICRLYPLLPVFEASGLLVATDRMGLYDVMEDIAGLDRACKVTNLPLHELDKLLTITAEIARDPVALYYVSAYRIAQDHLRERLGELTRGNGSKAFSAFESGLLLGRLIDHDRLRGRLSDLMKVFDDTYGERFTSTWVRS